MTISISTEISSKIQLLPPNLVDQIAAGEVVERPASVVKELIENAIDAGAENIDISIEDGGHKLIQIDDDGCGMNSRELEISFQRHATSKIKSNDDLLKVTSMGFRGEALPSIASISEVFIRTANNNLQGNESKISGGEVQFTRPAPRPQGTTFQVRDIFYNVPARKKFLKKKEVEARHIYQMVRKYMLGYPEIGFTYNQNGEEKKRLTSESLEERIISVMGKSYKNNVLPIRYTKGRYNVSGFVGNLNLVKKRRGEQFIFLNGRAIQDKLLNSAVMSSYKTVLSRGEFPFFLVNIEMPQEGIDVNVHPAKLEVRFQDEWRVYHVIKAAVSLVMKDILNVIPDLQFSSNFNKYAGRSKESDWLKFKPAEPSFIPDEVPPHQKDGNDFDIAPGTQQNFIERVNQISASGEKELPIVGETFWQIHNKYILTEIKGGLIIIDQHVAHERVLFEKAVLAMSGKGFSSQALLFPVTIKFQPEEYARFPEIVSYLEKIGFQMREFGENTIIVEGVPSDISQGVEEKVIREVLEFYCEHEYMKSEVLDLIAATYSCKAAIKAGDSLNPPEMKVLIDQLFHTEHPYYCPHGRPIIVNLGIEELDKRFERSW